MRRCARVVSLLACAALACAYPAEYEVHTFTAGIKYDHSVPMGGGTDRLRHPGSMAPFYISIATTAKSDYVIDYIEVTATVDAGADVAFCVVQGGPGSRTLLFQLSSNQTDFLTYSYRSFGLWSDDYNRVTAASVRPDNCNSRVHFDYNKTSIGIPSNNASDHFAL